MKKVELKRYGIKRYGIKRYGIIFAKGEQIENKEDLKKTEKDWVTLYREEDGDYFWIGMIWIEDIQKADFNDDGTIWRINEFRFPSRTIMLAEEIFTEVK